MSSEETLSAIHKEALIEFLEHGFLEASLRNIAKRAGVTTGAFYGYYKSKSQLFDALVKPHYETLLSMYTQTHNDFRTLAPVDQKNNMGIDSKECLLRMSEYIYDHLDAFKLILCCSEGTKYADIIHEMSELEVKANREFIAVMKDSGCEVQDFDPVLEHILISGMLSAFFETVRHNMQREKVQGYVNSLCEFYLAGWKKLMNISNQQGAE